MSSDNRAILFLTSWYPVEQDPFHGIFIHNHALALSMHAKVIVVYAYSSLEGPYFKVDEKKVNVNLMEYRVKYPKPKLDIPGIKAVVQFFKFRKAYRLLLKTLLERKIGIKAIQVNIVFPVSIVLGLFKKAFPVKHTIAENWSGYLASDGNYKGVLMKYYTRQCFAGSDKVWHVSELMKQAMLQHGLKGNFELLYNTVNTDVFNPKASTNSVTGEAALPIKFLHVSSLVEREKNISGTLRTLKRLQDKKYDFQLTIIGGSEETIADAKRIMGNLNLGNITFLGKLPPEKISEYMQENDALILFSHFEGMPVVALEALSCGLPVLATRVGQLPYLINDKFGKLVDVNDENQMTEVLENFVLGKYNFDSAAMHEFIIKYASFEAVGKQLTAYYETV
jgi:glycosyltransferase involved in cell wall biosynthesis